MATDDLPLITIGITCFNAQDTIADAVRGALTQDWPNLEIVVVDDCSTDESVAQIEAVIAGDVRVRLIRHEVNKGYPSALNSLVDAARGEFVAFFDDDDVSVPDRLRQQYERIVGYEAADHSTVVFCYSNRGIVLPGEEEVDHIAYAIGRKDPAPRGNMVADYILLYIGAPAHVWGLFGSCTLMLRRSVFNRVGVFDPAFRRCAEWDLAIQAAFMGAHFIAVDAPLVRQHKTPTADKAGKIPQKYQLMLRRKYRGYLRRKGAYLAALIMARSGPRHHKLRYYFMTGLACLLAPRVVLPVKMGGVFRRLSSVVGDEN